MKIALVGNQNCGKTTLFNLLTGSNQKVGNWPGVTIEQKSGYIKGTNFSIVDLPGIYSLSPYTPEEKVSRDYVLKENPDLIINIIDATNIERSLYLTTMLLETNSDVVIALNMADILEKSGIAIDVNKLEEILDTTVVKISALKKTGINELIDVIKNGNYRKNQHHQIFPDNVEKVIAKLSTHIDIPHLRFSIVKMLEKDPELSIAHPVEIEYEIAKLESIYKMDSEQIIADKRYEWITKVKDQCTSSFPVKESITKKLDKILLNKWLAIPIFILIMAAVYMLSVGVAGQYITSAISNGFNQLKEVTASAMKNGGASLWSISLLTDGVIGGVGSVLSFVPQIVILFICISFLEASGYMSRIAFFFDNIFHHFGLSGKSLIPFIVGSGCSVPGIMSSRIVEDDKEKRMTVVLTPLIPCSAKLPIISLFAGYIVGSSNGALAFLVAFLCYVIAIFLILVFSIILNKVYFKSESNSFLSELPDYKLPSPRYVFRDMLEKTWEFIKRAGTIILFASLIVWFLISFTWSFQYVDGSKVLIENSMLGGIGKAFAWLFYPMTGFQAGNNTWAVAVSAIQGLVAREQVVSSLQVISSKGGSAMFDFFRNVPITAVAYLLFVLYSAPCIASIGATYKETGSAKKTLFIVLWQFTSAWVLASLVGGFGTLITLGVRG